MVSREFVSPESNSVYSEETQSYSNDIEELDGKIASFTKTAKTPGGISLFTDETKQTYKSTYELLKEISEIYDDLSDKNQAKLLENLAGKNRGNQIAALLQAFQSGQVEKAYQASTHSDGSAQKEQERWLNSIEAKTQQFKAQFQDFSNSLVSSNFIKGIVDGGTQLLNILTTLIDKLGTIQTLIVGITAFKGIKSLVNSFSQLQQIGQIITAFKAGNDVTAVLKSFGSLSQAGLILRNVNIDGMNKVSLLQSAFGSTEEMATTALGIRAVGDASTASSVGIFGLSNAFKGLASSIGISSLALGGIVAAIAAVTVGFSAYQAYQANIEKQDQTAKESAQEWSSKKESLEEYKSQIEELGSSLESGNLTEQEAYNAKSQLLDIQKSLTESYGELSSGIDLVNGDYKKQLELVNKISVAEANRKLAKNESAYKRSEKEMSKERTYDLGNLNYIDGVKNSDANVKLFNLAKSFEDKGITLDKRTGSMGLKLGYTIKFTGDASEAEEVITDFSTKVRELQTDFNTNEDNTGSIFAEQILKSSEKALSDNDKTLEKYRDTYDEFLEMDLYNQGLEKGKPASILNDYTDAIEKYNEALESGDSSKIQEASTSFDEVQKSVDGVLNKYPRFQSIFDDAKDQLNTTAISSRDLNKVLTSSSDELKSNTFVADGLTEKQSKKLMKSYQDYQNILNEMNELGIDPSQTKFGNIDTNNRQVLKWTDENLQTYKEALQSWDEEAAQDFDSYAKDIKNSISTVFGSSAEFDGVEIAFSPMLQTDHGAELLDANTVYDYIYALIKDAGEGWTFDQLLELDSKGLEFNGKTIKNLIADVGDTAIQTGEAMHYLGKDGALNDSYNRFSKKAEKYGTSAENFTSEYKNYESPYKKFKDTANILKGLNLSDIDLKNAIDTDGIQKGEVALRNLIPLAKELGLIAEDASVEDSLSIICDSLIEAGIVSDGTSESIKNLRNSFTALESASDSVLSSITSVNNVLSSQQTGFSIDYGDFTSEDLTDYQTALEYVNGSLQLNAEKVKEISKAKADEQIASNDAAKAAAQADYLKNANEIDTLTASLAGLEETSSEYASIQNQIASLQSDNDEIALKCSQYDLLSQSIREANGEYQAWLDSQKASDYGDMFSDSLNAYDQIVNTFNPDSDIYGNFGSKKFDAAIDMIVPDSVDSDDLEAIQNYINDFKKYLTFDKDGKADGMNIEKFCQDAMDKGLMVLDEASGEYKVAGEKTMKDFEEGLNLSSAAVTSFFDQMLLKGAEFDWADEANKTLGDLGLSAAKAKQALQSIDGNENLKINIYTDDIDSSEEKIKTLNDTISEMQNLKANPEIDTESAERANEIIRYCVAQEQLLSQPIVMSVDASNASEDVQNAISSLQQFQQAKNELDVQIALKGDTTEAQAAVNEALSNIQGQAEIMAVLGIEDTSSVDKVLEGLQNQQPEILAKFGVKTDDVTSKVDEINNKKLEPKNTTLTALDYATPVIQGVIDALNKVQSKEVELKVTTNHVDTNSNTSSSSKKGTGSVSGTAHARGTAKLNGDWGLKSTKRVLIGELGREIVVDPHTGTWRTYGDNGAEFATIPKDAIVFNNAQSEDLLKNGYVNSRATALMRGTAFASGNAFVTGGISVSAAKASTINDYGSDDKSTKENTKAKDANTKATKKNTNVFDGVARKLKYFSNKTKAIADTITDYVTSAFKEIQVQRQIKSIDKEVSVNKKGEQAYLKKANSLTLSGNWKRRIRSGDYNIDDVTDDTLYKTIQKYQDYYDKATSCKQAVVDLRNQQLKLFEDLMNIPTEKAEKKIEKLSKKYDMLSASQNAIMVGESTSSKLYSLQNSTYSSASSNKKKSKNSLKKANKAIKKTKSKLTKSQKKDAGKRNNLISTKGLKGKELKNAQAYNDAVKKQRKLKTNDETNSILLSYYSQDFPNLSDYKNEPSYEYANDILDKQLKNERQQNKARQEAYKKSTSNLVKIRKTKNNADKNESKARKKIKKNADLMKKLSKSQKKDLNSGKKVSTKGLSSKQKQKIKAYNKAVIKSDKIDQKYNIAYNAQQTSAKNAAESQSELAQKIVQNELDKFDNIKNFYDAKIDYRQSLTDTVDKQVELSEAHGNYITQKDYHSKISSRKTTKALNEEKLKNLEQQLASSVKSGVIKEGSTEWLQLKTEIAETANEIQSCTVDIENLNQESIKAKYEEMFDRAIDKAQQFIDKLDTINSIITDDMKFDDNGKLTDLGALSMVLNANQMNTELSNLQKYIQKRQKIILDYKAEMFGEESYNEQMKENDSNMQSSLKNLNGYRTAILDMVKEQSKTELDALNKVMDARKKALQKKKDYYDYDKQLKDKNKEIALLQQQIRALDGVTDAESKARKAKLEADLKEKQNDLSDTIRDHVYELQVTGIDDLKDALQEDYDKYVKELAQNLDKMTEAISNAVSSTTADTAGAMIALKKLLKSMGLSDDQIAQSGLGEINKYANGTKNAKGGLSKVNERGNELIVFKDGSVLMPITHGSSVFTAEQTSNLFEMAKNYQHGSLAVQKMTLPNVKVGGGETIAPVINCPIEIQGNANEQDVINALNKAMPKISQRVQSDIRKDLRKAGIK